MEYHCPIIVYSCMHCIDNQITCDVGFVSGPPEAGGMPDPLKLKTGMSDLVSSPHV